MRPILPCLATLVLLAACDARRTTESAAPPPDLQELVGPWLAPAAPASTAAAAGGSNVERDLERLRGVTAPFHDFDAARHAGWSLKVTSCMTDPALGGMGFHYGNPELIDGTARAGQPEVLLYQPQRDGTMQLVGVEYIVPLDRWRGASPPRLFNRDFKVNAAFGVWALHVWVWKENPGGLFADWNPKVNCEHTTDIQPMSASAH